ncbi:DUF2235 domain-containing protein [Psychromonas aquimarina]|uniref:DUF2235 domain-containing protein n=1 Tax=Psychromonas aquimarina TaxID=444919 RepID=UPI0004094095|nr:DUF2235 domain-containing protein [Psychromonas aquimarina]
MRNLIVCCDGTWNDPNNEDDNVPAPTNVRKLFEAVDLKTSSPKQLSRYQAGVGTGGLVDKVMGGIVGYGLSEDIRDCYQWLSDKYQAGDRIFLFGFSRGAFTARSLAGLIGKYGLIDFSLHQKDSRNQIVQQVYRDAYRNDKALDGNVHFHENSKQIDFIGVWDTVGALGVPDDKALLNIFDNSKKYQFHDVTLGDHIINARHALALNEKRGSFTPTLWSTQRNDDTLKQIWFPGVHSDVGGGYKEQGLSDGALKWMIDEACSENLPDGGGIKLQNAMIEQIKPDPMDIEHDSHVGAMKALISAPRTIPNLDRPGVPVHHSVMLRRETAPINQGCYMDTRNFIDGRIELDIYAKHPWNWTGIYLEKGKTYSFTASGEWMDAEIPCPAQGATDGKFHTGEIAHVALTITGWVEKGWKKLLKNEQADFFGSKRVEHADWFCLMGAIANGGNPGRDGTHETLEQFEIGAGNRIKVHESGYLYCFANDAWGFYGNNRGYVTLTVEED